MRAAVAAVLIALVLAGCGDEEEPGAGAEPGDVPVTARALAAVAAEYAGDPASAQADEQTAMAFTAGGVAAELRYGSDGEYDGDMLGIAVGTDPKEFPTDCANPPSYASDGCVEVDGTRLFWADEEPEEDPGIVYLVRTKGSTTVLVVYAGPKIHGDPREDDLPIDVDTLLDLTHDPRVDATTSQDAIDAGDDLGYWKD